MMELGKTPSSCRACSKAIGRLPARYHSLQHLGCTVSWHRFKCSCGRSAVVRRVVKMEKKPKILADSL